jgi:hypothetical protein
MDREETPQEPKEKREVRNFLRLFVRSDSTEKEPKTASKKEKWR